MKKKPAGLKLDDGKLRYALIDENAEREFVAVLTFGALKYSRLQEECTCGVANAGSRSKHAGSAELVTIGTSAAEIRSTPSGSVRARRLGGRGIGNGPTPTKGDAVAWKTQSRSGRGTTGRSMGSRSMKRSASSEQAARSAAPSSASESIIAMRTGKSGAVFATPATSDWGSWSVPGTGLKGHSPTCKANTWIDGAGNWRTLDELERRYFEAARRHLSAPRRGESLDPETRMHHYAGALCSIHFLLAYEMEKHPELVRSFDKRFKEGLAVAREIRAAREAKKTQGKKGRRKNLH